MEVADMIQKYVGDTVCVRNRHQSIVIVDNIKKFIGNLYKYGKQDKIQVHTVSMIGAACYGGSVSSRALVRLLGLGRNSSKNSRKTRLTMEDIVEVHRMRAATALETNNTSIIPTGCESNPILVADQSLLWDNTDNSSWNTGDIYSSFDNYEDPDNILNIDNNSILSTISDMSEHFFDIETNLECDWDDEESSIDNDSLCELSQTETAEDILGH